MLKKSQSPQRSEPVLTPTHLEAELDRLEYIKRRNEFKKYTKYSILAAQSESYLYCEEAKRAVFVHRQVEGAKQPGAIGTD